MSEVLYFRQTFTDFVSNQYITDRWNSFMMRWCNTRLGFQSPDKISLIFRPPVEWGKTVRYIQPASSILVESVPIIYFSSSFFVWINKHYSSAIILKKHKTYRLHIKHKSIVCLWLKFEPSTKCVFSSSAEFAHRSSYRTNSNLIPLAGNCSSFKMKTNINKTWLIFRVLNYLVNENIQYGENAFLYIMVI